MIVLRIIAFILASIVMCIVGFFLLMGFFIALAAFLSIFT